MLINTVRDVDRNLILPKVKIVIVAMPNTAELNSIVRSDNVMVIVQSQLYSTVDFAP